VQARVAAGNGTARITAARIVAARRRFIANRLMAKRALSSNTTLAGSGTAPATMGVLGVDS
jgi:hypothetical protein